MNIKPPNLSRSIPFMDLSASFGRIYPEIMAKLQLLIQKTQFIGGEEVKLFEREFAKYCGTKYAIACGNGTDALTLSLKALGIGQGDVVVTVPNTFIATAEAITAVGARVAFIDVDEEFYTMCPEKLKEYLENNYAEKIKAVLPVHLYGQMVDMKAIKEVADEFNLKIIEDAAQAHGAELDGRRAGAYGEMAAFSFYPGKNLGAFGDAGAVVTNHEELAAKIKMLSDHGRKKKYEHEIEGFNSRMDTIQAAVLRIKLKHLENWTRQRIEKAGLYDLHLRAKTDITLPMSRANARHVFHLYVIQAAARDEVRKKLGEKNIATGVHYPLPLHLQPAFHYLGYSRGDFPVAERLAEKIFSLPLWPEIGEQQIKYVCNNL